MCHEDIALLLSRKLSTHDGFCDRSRNYGRNVFLVVRTMVYILFFLVSTPTFNKYCRYCMLYKIDRLDTEISFSYHSIYHFVSCNASPRAYHSNSFCHHSIRLHTKK
mmetsp:Transcript_25877/g.57000  ORF Transcript_25877/g.57000 Transcript_25877/m.57000 type:complete len:107 (+) Transcript_25877:280-600(+)